MMTKIEPTNSSVQVTIKDVVDGAGRASENECSEEVFHQGNGVCLNWETNSERPHGVAPGYPNESKMR